MIMESLKLSNGQVLPDQYQEVLVRCHERLKTLREGIKKLGDMV